MPLRSLPRRIEMVLPSSISTAAGGPGQCRGGVVNGVVLVRGFFVPLWVLPGCVAVLRRVGYWLHRLVGGEGDLCKPSSLPLC